MLLSKARALKNCEEIAIADAFLKSKRNKNDGLAILSRIKSPVARSATLRMVHIYDEERSSIAWFDASGLTPTDIDAEGKLLILMSLLSLEEWDRAATIAAAISEADFVEAPVLLHAVAMTNLIQVVPSEFRTFLMGQVPFGARTYPLDSDENALAARRRAIDLFSRTSDFALSMGVASASNSASDYALWLKLKDPTVHPQGMDELRASMRDPVQSLRRLNLALQFGIKIDIPAVERQIEQRVALSGSGTADEAFARFALAFTKDDPRGVASYIAQHRQQLYEHLQRNSVQSIEIEMLARGGLVEQARQQLVNAIADGLSQREQQSLERIIAEATGTDPIAARKAQYESTGSLLDLRNLVIQIEELQMWADLVPYAEALFAQTGSLEDASRLATALDAVGDHRKLYDFLDVHHGLVIQSIGLRTIWAWTLYREGRFADARSALTALAKERDDPNNRALRVNLAIASGDWNDLVLFTSTEWDCRDARTAAELLTAGQLAQAAGAPHARDLVTAAAERGGDDPTILAAAYFHSTSAGWDHNVTSNQWLSRAVVLSGGDGPLKSITIKELTDQKPQWDKQESWVWQQLNAGQIPAFGAAKMLGRSLIDFTMLAPLANFCEGDPRRRNIVYAYSGARSGFVPPKPTRVALDLAAIITLAHLDLLSVVISTYPDLVIPATTMGWLFQERQSARFHQPSRIKDAHQLKRLISAGTIKVLPRFSVGNQPLDREIGNTLADLLSAARARMEAVKVKYWYGGDTLLSAARARMEADRHKRCYVVRSAPVHRISSLMDEEADLSDYMDMLCICQSVVTALQSKGQLTQNEAESARNYLKLQEKRWTSEPAISGGAELYIDDLSITYLRVTGILDKFSHSGLTVFISENSDHEANRLISLEALSERQLEIIESIRHCLAEGIRSGQVHAVRSRETHEPDAVWMNPTFAILGMDTNADALVIDDRYLNRPMINWRVKPRRRQL